jgi:hypothetical protein
MAADTVILNCAQMQPTVPVIDYLARVRLGLQLGGRTLRLGGASEGLLDLIRFCGLEDALRVQVEGQPEEREELGGVEEERELGDPPV